MWRMRMHCAVPVTALPSLCTQAHSRLNVENGKALCCSSLCPPFPLHAGSFTSQCGEWESTVLFQSLPSLPSARRLIHVSMWRMGKHCAVPVSALPSLCTQAHSRLNVENGYALCCSSDCPPLCTQAHSRLNVENEKALCCSSDCPPLPLHAGSFTSQCGEWECTVLSPRSAHGEYNKHNHASKSISY
ncbi:UNVERIFIED_CONTAM: hypothetical protein FKN15_068465 [Acipenser sinensis]